MIRPDLAPDEPLRLAAVRATNLLDTPLEERFERITRLAKHMLGTATAAVSLVEAGRQWFKSAQGLPMRETPRNISFCGHVILQDDVFVVPDARSDPRFHDNPLLQGEAPCVFYAGCPLSLPDGSKVGTLCVTDPKPRTLSDTEKAVLKDLAALAEHELRASLMHSVQWELLSQIEVERRRAMVDPLTRLWNRDGVLAVLDTECARAQAEEIPLSVMMIDIDCFKRFNDEGGHACGDRTLRDVSARLLATIREVDTVGRIGGDEFLVVLSAGASRETALALAERVRRNVAELRIDVQGKPRGVTVSVGVATADSGANFSEAELVEQADASMYRAKSLGKNRVAA